MKTSKRKRYAAEFKAKVALEAIPIASEIVFLKGRRADLGEVRILRKEFSGDRTETQSTMARETARLDTAGEMAFMREFGRAVHGGTDLRSARPLFGVRKEGGPIRRSSEVRAPCGVLLRVRLSRAPRWRECRGARMQA